MFGGAEAEREVAMRRHAGHYLGVLRLAGGLYLEGGDDVMRGLASMIEASRAYQLNATMIQMQDQMTGQAVSRIARVA